jgi:TonB family protein
MQTKLIQVISHLWLPIVIWTLLSLAFLLYQQLVYNSSKSAKKINSWVNSIIWLLPLSVFSQFIIIKLFAAFEGFNSLPTVFDATVNFSAITVGSSGKSSIIINYALFCITALWLLGSLFGLFGLAISWLSIMKRVRNMHLIHCEDLPCYDERDLTFIKFNALIQKTKIRLSDSAVSPSVINAFSPTIILPKALLGNDRLLKIALVHELVHIKNRDLTHALINQLIKIFFWMHPIIHFYAKWASKTREQQCDIEVISNGFINKAEYATALVEVSTYYAPLSLVCMAEKTSHLKARIQELISMNPSDFNKPTSTQQGLLSFSFISIIASLVLLNPKNEVINTNISSNANEVPMYQGDFSALIEGDITAIFTNITYPDEARENGIQGRVEVQFVVNEKGRAVDIQIIKGIGYGCDEAAIETIKSTVFKPLTVEGTATQTRVKLPIVFKLQK